MRTNIDRRFFLPKYLDDGRLDSILEIIEAIKEGNSVELSFDKTEKISPAGHAILFVLLDVASEQKINLTISGLDTSKLLVSKQIADLNNKRMALQGFFPIEKLKFNSSKVLVYGKASTIAPEFIELIEQKFKSFLNEDRLWDVSLILNELMQNAVDHSTSERYFLYAGVNDKSFEFGILDMGVTIPAKLETKYMINSDEDFLEKAFERGIGTRRNRSGGMGLFYLFEHVKESKGRLVILSRNAQVRKNFGTRNYRASKLKKTLFGTWCMASIPLE